MANSSRFDSGQGLTQAPERYSRANLDSLTRALRSRLGSASPVFRDVRISGGYARVRLTLPPGTRSNGDSEYTTMVALPRHISPDEAILEEVDYRIRSLIAEAAGAGLTRMNRDEITATELNDRFTTRFPSMSELRITTSAAGSTTVPLYGTTATANSNVGTSSTGTSGSILAREAMERSISELNRVQEPDRGRLRRVMVGSSEYLVNTDYIRQDEPIRFQGVPERDDFNPWTLQTIVSPNRAQSGSVSTEVADSYIDSILKKLQSRMSVETQLSFDGTDISCTTKLTLSLTDGETLVTDFLGDTVNLEDLING